MSKEENEYTPPIKIQQQGTVTNEAMPAIRRIHKSDFIERMLPYWADIKATREADSIVDGYFEMFNFYKFVDLDWPKTQAMIADLKSRILAVNPDSKFNVEEVLKDGTDEEHYRG